MRMMTPYWNRGSIASDLFDEVDRLFSQSARTAYDERSFHPQYDITEDETHFMLSIDLPGMTKDEIKIDITDQLLSVSGERKARSTNKGHFERTFGYFKRSFSLPKSINTEDVEASYENGVLELYLPKTAKATPRQIEIKSSSEGIFKSLSEKTTSSETPIDA